MIISWGDIFGYLYDAGERIHQFDRPILKNQYIEISVRAIQRYPKYKYTVIQRHWLKLKESKYSANIMAFLFGSSDE